MSDKQDQKKKDGERTDKKHEQMRENVHARQEQAEKTAEGDPHQMEPGRANRSGTKS
jgi:hypothetical protein